MKQDILLLTKSKKKSGYCVAGISISTGKWTRLNMKGFESVPAYMFKYDDGTAPQVLDTISVEITEDCPTEMHPEDVYFDNKSVTRKESDNTAYLKKQAYSDFAKHDYIYYDNNFKLYDDLYPNVGAEEAYSLMTIVPEELFFYKNSKGKILACFRYKGKQYSDLRVTDIEFIKSMNDYPPEERYMPENDVYLVISLGEVFFNKINGKNEYYKLVASVIDGKKITQTEPQRSGDAFPEGMSKKDFIGNIVAGYDPFTMEPIGENSLLKNDLILKMLVKEFNRLGNNLTAAGSSWTDEEDNQLDKEFLEDKLSIEKISQIHERTVGAIRARLVKHGLIEK